MGCTASQAHIVTKLLSIFEKTILFLFKRQSEMRRDVYFSCLGFSDDDVLVNLVFGLVPFRKRCDKVCMLSVCLF